MCCSLAVQAEPASKSRTAASGPLSALISAYFSQFQTAINKAAYFRNLLGVQVRTWQSFE